MDSAVKIPKLSHKGIKGLNGTSIFVYFVYKEEREKNIQAANRREEERQAGCHTSKTGTQLQQTAEITEHEGKRNTKCERHMYPVIQTEKETG